MSTVITLLLSAMAAFTAPKNAYPDHWWKPVPQSDLASWEIPPQAADRSKNEVILSKRNELGLLSNFADTPFTLDGIKYGSVEGLWQAMKYPEGPNDERLKDSSVVWPFTRAQVAAMTAFEAKDAGKIAGDNMKKLKISWITYQGKKIEYKTTGQQAHYDVIYAATVAKVNQNPSVRTVLLKTGSLNLRPDHAQEPNSPPAYAYFDIAMKIRASLD